MAYQRIYSISEISPNKWYQATLTFDINKKIIYFYLNGKLQGKTTMNIGNGLRDRPYNIGRDPVGRYYFYGFIDNVRIYSEALSSAQIQKLYVQELKKYKIATK